MPAGRVRAYVSNLYQEVYDAACAARRPHLDVRVLLPKEAASGGTDTASLSSAPSVFTATGAVDDGVVGARGEWITKDGAELEPDLQLLLSDEPQGHHLAALNTLRVRAGLAAVQTVSLEEVAKRAYNPDYFYAEDMAMEIPRFKNVRFCPWGRGGCFEGSSLGLGDAHGGKGQGMTPAP